MNILIKVSAGISAALVASVASAALISGGGLQLDTDPTVSYQQTDDDPCVIGGNDCDNGSFPYTLAGSGGAGSTFDLSSPLYTTAQILEANGGSTSFIVGFDYNQTNDPQLLTLFEACYYAGATQLSCQTFDVPTSLDTNNNGVGFSDFLLSGFTLAAGTTNVQFNATWFNNDGPDSYFLIAADSETPEVPEPGTLALLGLGFAAFGFARRRKS